MVKQNGEYYLVEAAVLPEVFAKVTKVKELLSTGAVGTVNEAAARIGISRSAYYKYKDYVFPFYELAKDRILTMTAILQNKPGVLSSLIGYFAKCNCNIMTINQSIPSSGVAPVSVSVDTGSMTASTTDFLESLRKLDGVLEVTLIGKQ